MRVGKVRCGRAAALLVFLAVISGGCFSALGCTSAIAGRSVARDGRTLLWKHRDSGHPHNFVAKVNATDSTMAYVALFNAGDSALAEAWVGFNEAGFAVMNTASYNLAPDTASVKDREGLVMSEALARCRTVADFRDMLNRLTDRGPLGVQANFGVTDAAGNGAYFETTDHDFVEFPLDEASGGLLVRSNYSYSGGDEGKLGAVRHDNAVALLGDVAASVAVTAETFTETLSRSFYHSGRGRDMASDRRGRLTDRGEYIPRRSSCASVVIEGALDGEDAAASTVMWVAIGFPTASHVEMVTLDSVPQSLLPTSAQGHSALCDEVNARRDRAFPARSSRGKWLVNLDYLIPLSEQERKISEKNYAEGRRRRDSAAAAPAE